VKKILSTLAVALVALVVSSGSSLAQGGPPGGGMRGGARMTEMLFKDITLTEAQVAQRDSILKVFQSQMPAMTPGTPPSPEDRQKRMEVMAKQNEALKGILTDEQKKVFEKNLADMQAMRRPQ
jgi:Spy/CpxP family protein refolding chaperone